MPSVVNANMRMRLLNEDELDPPNLFEDLRECLAQEGRRSDQMFRQFDIDGTGGVDREEFAIVCKEMGYDASPEELDALFKAFDKDGNGKLAYTVRMAAPPPPAPSHPAAAPATGAVPILVATPTAPRHTLRHPTRAAVLMNVLGPKRNCSLLTRFVRFHVVDPPPSILSVSWHTRVWWNGTRYHAQIRAWHFPASSAPSQV